MLQELVRVLERDDVLHLEHDVIDAATLQRAGAALLGSRAFGDALEQLTAHDVEVRLSAAAMQCAAVMRQAAAHCGSYLCAMT